MDIHGDSPETATDLSISPFFFDPIRVRGELRPRGDEDWFRVSLKKGDWYWIDTRDVDFVGAPTVELLSDGKAVAQLNKQFGTIFHQAERSGEFFIRVSVDVSPRTKYALAVSKFESPNALPRATVISKGQPSIFGNRKYFWEEDAVFGFRQSPPIQFFFKSGSVPFSLSSRGQVFASDVLYQVKKADTKQMVPSIDGFDGKVQQFPFYARLNWGNGHRKWTRTSILALPDYSSALGKKYIKGRGISYSFDDVAPNYYDSNEYSDYQPLTAQQKQAFRTAIAAWSKFLNINFYETRKGYGEMRIGSRFLDEPFEAYQRNSPWHQFGNSTRESDVFISNKNPNLQNLREGSLGFYHVLQSVGIALGLNPPDVVDARLDPDVRNSMYTVMSNNNHPKFGDVYPSSPALFDILQLQDNYRIGRVNGKQSHTFSTSGQTRSSIMASSGKDIVSAAGHNYRATIRLETNEFSYIGSKSNYQHFWVNSADTRESPLLNTFLETAIGGNRADRLVGSKERNQLFGGPGNDILIGRQGNDFLNGGKGNDRYHWQLGDGSDTIRERNGHGNDLIQIQSDWGLVDFEKDLTFRKKGNDLVISLDFDNGNANQGTLTVRDMAFQKSQIESLRILGENNRVIVNRVSLVSVWTQLMQPGVSGNQSLTISATQDPFGSRVKTL